MSQQRYSSFNALRFAFILGIFLFHFCHEKGGQGLWIQGFSGVTFFYILSGFILTDNYSERIITGQVTAKTFITKRLKTIYPIYFLTVVFFIVKSITAHYPCWKMAIVHLLLLQSWIPDESVFLCWNYPAWFLSSLMFCYILFIPLVKLFDRHFKWTALVLCCLYACYIIIQLSFNYNNKSYYEIYFPPSRLLDFTIGMMLCHLSKNNDHRTIRSTKATFVANSLIELSSIALLIAFYIYSSNFPYIFLRGSYYWIPMGLIVYCFARTNNNSLFSFLSKNKEIQLLGNISLAFFLIHGIIIDLLRIILSQYKLFNPWFVLTLTIILSYLLYFIQLQLFKQKG